MKESEWQRCLTTYYQVSGGIVLKNSAYVNRHPVSCRLRSCVFSSSLNSQAYHVCGICTVPFRTMIVCSLLLESRIS